MIFAFDKLYNEVKKFKSKYAHIPGLNKIVADVEKHIQITANTIGSPEIEWFDGQITFTKVIAVREKLSANQTPIFPLHMYRDINRFESAKEIVKSIKRERSRKKHYDNAQRELDIMSTKVIELTQANADLVAQIQQLQKQNAELNQEKETMAAQIASIRNKSFGKILFNLAQRKK